MTGSSSGLIMPLGSQSGRALLFSPPILRLGVGIAIGIGFVSHRGVLTRFVDVVGKPEQTRMMRTTRPTPCRCTGGRSPSACKGVSANLASSPCTIRHCPDHRAQERIDGV
jgi:hypothetical protein